MQAILTSPTQSKFRAAIESGRWLGRALVLAGFGAACFELGGCMPTQSPAQPETIEMFDGKTLAGWKGDPTYWSVRDGALVGEVTPATLLQHNSFIIWQGDMPADFELTVAYRISKLGNSGINYRSEQVEGSHYALRGYQADLDGRNKHTGSTYEERRRTIIAAQGESVQLPELRDPEALEEYTKGNKYKARKVLGKLGTRAQLHAHIKADDWNEYRIVARGNHLRHFVNGVLMSEVVDDDPVHRRFDGLLGVQVHVGPPMKVEYRNFRLSAL